MSGTKWRQSMQVLKEKQNYLQKQKLTSLLRDQQRTPANPRMPHLLSLSLDFLVPLIQIRKKAQDSQESSPSLQFKGSSSSVLSLLYGPTLKYTTTVKTIALTIQTFVGKVMSLLLNMLSRLVITFLPRSKCLLISWMQLPSAVILEPPPKKKV